MLSRVQVEVPDDAYWRRQIKCQEACPVHTDARGYVRAIAEGRYEDAYLIARGPNPLASICGRVCGAPCEAACRRRDIDQAVSIRALKRFVTDRFTTAPRSEEPATRVQRLVRKLIDQLPARQSSRSEELTGFRQFLTDRFLPRREDGERIAVIGSGPAGLAAAHDLALLGFRPTVFEMEPVPAGMLAVGIPEYRLSRELIAAEVEFIRALGVEFRCNTRVGQDITLDEIRQTHRATIIAVGLKRSRALPLPGAHGAGLIGGVELLRDVALQRPVDLRGDVVVIGGGNVAYDIARTVIRQLGIDISRTALRQEGVHSVHLCSLESLEEMPADDAEILEGDEEGVIRHNSLGPKEILLDEQGRVSGVVFHKCLRVFDDQGRFAPTFDAACLTTIPANTVIWGVGQQPDLTFIDSQADIQRTERGMIACDAATCRTSAADVFIAGDVAYGPKLLIHAVASGKQAARAVYEYLRGEKLVEQVELVHLELPEYEREPDYEKLRRTPIGALDVRERRFSQTAQVELGYGEREAVREASRCLDCGVNTVFDSSKCILCGGCADVCPETCLELVSVTRLIGDEALHRTLAQHLQGADADQVSAIVKDETRCIRCALCAERCPVGAITMERVLATSCWSATRAS